MKAMETIIKKIDKNQIDEDAIREAGEILSIPNAFLNLKKTSPFAYTLFHVYAKEGCFIHLYVFYKTFAARYPSSTARLISAALSLQSPTKLTCTPLSSSACTSNRFGLAPTASTT